MASGCNCGKPEQVWNPTPYNMEIPPLFPPMDIPADNPLTEEGVHLGKDVVLGDLVERRQLHELRHMPPS